MLALFETISIITLIYLLTVINIPDVTSRDKTYFLEEFKQMTNM